MQIVNIMRSPKETGMHPESGPDQHADSIDQRCGSLAGADEKSNWRQQQAYLIKQPIGLII